MKLSAVLLARVLGFIETVDLNPRGTVFYPDLAAAIVERFRFQKFPQKIEEFDEQKGVDFFSGTWDGTNVERLTVYSNGVLLDTRASTAESERILEEALLWASDKFKLRYEAGTIKRKRHLSQLTFYTEVPILGAGKPLTNLCDRIGRSVESIMGKPLSYESCQLHLDFERYGQIPIAAFLIQRRVDTPFSEKKYFSEAPLPTDLHYRLLEQFEADLLSNS